MKREEEYAIIANNISKIYKMYANPMEKMLDFLLPRSYGKEFYALNELSFKVKKGDIVGLVGLNGSGKSTLAEIVGGISVPSKGSIVINGNPAVIAISAGLNIQLTGLENIELKGLMSGLKKEEIDNLKQSIIEFADIGDHMYQPVKTYSSGMRSRLGFAISVNIAPDILVIDEALSVGDPTFTQKCLDKMYELRDSGRTIFFVSHSLEQMRKFCNSIMWIEYGRLKVYGEVNEVIDEYSQFISSFNKMSIKQKAEYRKRFGRA